MDNCIPRCDTSKKTRKRFKTHKPYWNDQLKDSWNAMYAKEKRFFFFFVFFLMAELVLKHSYGLNFSHHKKLSIKHCVGTHEHINDRFAMTSKI